MIKNILIIALIALTINQVYSACPGTTWDKCDTVGEGCQADDTTCAACADPGTCTDFQGCGFDATDNVECKDLVCGTACVSPQFCAKASSYATDKAVECKSICHADGNFDAATGDCSTGYTCNASTPACVWNCAGGQNIDTAGTACIANHACSAGPDCAFSCTGGTGLNDAGTDCDADHTCDGTNCVFNCTGGTGLDTNTGLCAAATPNCDGTNCVAASEEEFACKDDPTTANLITDKTACVDGLECKEDASECTSVCSDDTTNVTKGVCNTGKECNWTTGTCVTTCADDAACTDKALPKCKALSTNQATVMTCQAEGTTNENDDEPPTAKDIEAALENGFATEAAMITAIEGLGFTCDSACADTKICFYDTCIVKADAFKSLQCTTPCTEDKVCWGECLAVADLPDAATAFQEQLTEAKDAYNAKTAGENGEGSSSTILSIISAIFVLLSMI